MLNTAKNNDKDFLKDKYEDEKRFRSIAMITDLPTGKNIKKKKGALFVVPLFEAGLIARLKNITVVTSAVNTCQSETAVTGDAKARKYVDETKDRFDHFDGQIGELSKNPNCKYKKEDFDYVNNFFKGIKDNIPHEPQDSDNITRGIYESNGAGTDLPGTLERVNPKNLKVWAFALDGYNDSDRVQIVDDRNNRNPVQVFLGYKIHSQNGSDLRSLIGQNQFRTINDCLMKKLGNKDFSREKRNASKLEGYKYYLSYFVQSVFELFLVDNQYVLNLMQIDLIGENWLKFLSDLKDNSKSDLFDKYEYDESEIKEQPKKFVGFMLNKLLGPELLKELGIGDNEFALYALAADGFSELLAGADHANQIIAMAFNNNSSELTYNDSLFIGQGSFVYAPLWSAYKTLDRDTKNKLKLLAFQLKHKKIDFDQDLMETVDEYRFGRPQEPEHNNNDNKKEITGIKYRASKCYDTDISPGEFMDLVLEIKEITEKFNTKFSDYQQKSKNSELQEEDISSLLDLLCDAAEIGITLTDGQDDGQLEFVCKNEAIMKKLCDLLTDTSDKNLDREKYEILYKWLVNEHNRAIILMNREFCHFEFIGDTRLCDFYNSFNANDEKTNFILNLNMEHSLLKNKSFVEKISYNVISDMFLKDSDKANKILRTIVPFLKINLVKSINFGKLDLAKETIENIIFCRCKDLDHQQIKEIDFSGLDVRCARLVILFLIYDTAKYVPDEFLKTCPLEILKELTTKQFFDLMDCLINGDNENVLRDRKDYLQSLCIEDLFTHCKDSKNLALMKSFFDQYADFLSDEQLLSIRGEFISGNNTLKNKLESLYEKSDLNKNIGQIMQFFGSNDIEESKLVSVLSEIKKHSKNEFNEIIAHLFKNCRIYYNVVDQMLSAIRNDKTGVRDSIHEILLSDVPNESKKYVNYLDLSRLKLAINQLASKKFLAYLSDEQYNNIQLGSKNIGYKDLKNIINGFGSKTSHRQLEKLIEDYNETALKDADSDDAKQYLIKIVLISNIICDKEKSFEKKYGQMFKDIDDLKNEEFGSLVGYMAQIAFATKDERDEYMDACRKFNYDNGNDEDINKKSGNNKDVNEKTNYAEIKKLLDALNQNIQQKEDEMKKENVDKNAIKQIDMKIGEEIKQLSARLSSSIKQIQNDIKDPSGKVEELFSQLANLNLNFNAKREGINKLKEAVEPYKDVIDQIKTKIRALEEPFIKFKQNRMSWCRGFKNKFFDVLKQLDTKKANKTMQGITVEFEKLLNNDNGSNLLSPLLTLETDEDKIKNDENLEQMESKKTFQEFFMDNFIGIQCTGKHHDANFTTEQKGNLGIVNVLQAGKCEKIENKTKVSLEQYTPEYILSNLPFILQNCHVDRENLDQAMRDLNLHNLTLKFENGKKQSLEKFVDSPLLMDSDNNWYFEAVKKLFCDHADNIYAEANLILEKDRQNAAQTSNTHNIQTQFHKDLKTFLRLTTKQRLIERKRDSNGNQVEIIEKKITVELNPESIYKNMRFINWKRFYFFCGDWMCASRTFRSSENFLSDFKSYVRKRIDFGVDRGLEIEINLDDRYFLDDRAYDFLIGLTLFSGFIDQGTEIKDDIIAEICSLLTGKDQNEKFSSDDMKLVFDCYMEISKSKNLNATSERIIKYMINHKRESITPQSVIGAYHDISNDNKGFILEYVSSAYSNTNHLDILEVAFGPDCKFLERITEHSLNVTPDFFNKIMQEITTQLDKNPEFIEQKEDLLSKFFKFWNDKDQNCVIENPYIDWPSKVSSKKSIEAIIRIFSNLDNLQLKQKMFEAIVAACLENKKLGDRALFDALSMFEKCSYCNWTYCDNPEFKVEFVDKYIMDAIKNYPGKIGEAEINNLRYFLKVCKINEPDNAKDGCKIRSRWFKVIMEKFSDGLLSEDVAYRLIDKTPIKLNIQETKKLTVLFKKGGIQEHFFESKIQGGWLKFDGSIGEYLGNAEAMFSRPIEFDFNLDNYVKELKGNDLASENERMIFLNLCCSKNKNVKRFDFDKFVKHIPKHSLGRIEINYIGDLLWLTNKRKIDLATMKTLVEVSSDIYALKNLLDIYYRNEKYEDKHWNIDVDAKRFLNNEIKNRTSEDIEKIWLDGFDDKKCPENLLFYSEKIGINNINYDDKNVYVIVDSLYRLNKLQGKDKIDIDLDVMKKMCNINVDLSIITKVLTLGYPRSYSKVFQLKPEASKYLNERIENERNIIDQLSEIKEDAKLLKSEGIGELIKKFTEAEITKIFSKTMQRLCDVSFDLEELKKIIADNNIAISAEAEKTLENKMAARKKTREKLDSILSKEPGSLKNANDIKELLRLLPESDGREINLDRMKQLCNIIGDLVCLENILNKRLRELGGEYPWKPWEISKEAKEHLKNAVKQYKIVRRNEALNKRMTEGKSSINDIWILAEYYREVGDTKINLEEIKKLCHITNDIENLSLIRYCFSHNGMQLETDAEKYINQQIKEKAQSAIDKWSNADTEQLCDSSEMLIYLYYAGVTEIDLTMMNQLCKTSDNLSDLCDDVCGDLTISSGVDGRGNLQFASFEFGVTKDAAAYLYKYIDNKKQEEMKKKLEEAKKNNEESQKDKNEIKKTEETKNDENKNKEIKDESSIHLNQKENKEKKDENKFEFENVKNKEEKEDINPLKESNVNPKNNIGGNKTKDKKQEGLTTRTKNNETQMKSKIAEKNKATGGITSETNRLKLDKIVPIDQNEQDKNDKKTKWPQILSKMGKVASGLGIGGFIVLLILFFLLDISSGLVFSPMLFVVLGGLSWKIGEYFDNKISQAQDMEIMQLQNKSPGLIDQIERNQGEEQQKTIENESQNQDKKNKFQL